MTATCQRPTTQADDYHHPKHSKKAIADYLGWSSESIDRHRRDGNFPDPVRLGKGRSAPVRWSMATIDTWLIEQQG